MDQPRRSQTAITGGTKRRTPVSRRELLVSAALASFAAAYTAACSGEGTSASPDVRGASGPSGTSASTGGAGVTSSSPAQALTLDPDLHLLKRLTAAPTVASLAALKSSGRDNWMQAQLGAPQAESPGLTALIAALDKSVADLDIRANPQAARQTISAALAAKTLAMSAFSTNQLREVITSVWADHLHVTSTKQPEIFVLYAYDQMLREKALDKFADLLLASAQSPAMMVYLDQARSRADGANVPNENYARELLELHTMGVDAPYSEQDVRNVAYVLSGWTADRETRTFRFAPNRHNLGPAAGADILGFRPAGAGLADGVGLLNHIARRPETARFVSWKLARRLIRDDLTIDDPVVVAAAKVYSNADTSVRAVVEHLIGSDAFGSHMGTMFRRPLDHLAGVLRVGCSEPTTLGGRTATLMRGSQAVLGQFAYGWPSPDGYPTQGAAWANGGALVGRWNVTMGLWMATLPGLPMAVPGSAVPGDSKARAASMVREHLAVEDDALSSVVESILATAPDPSAPDRETTAAALTVIAASPQFALR